LLALEPAEEAADARIATRAALGRISVDDPRTLVGRQRAPGYVQPNAPRLGGAFEQREMSAVVGLAPRLDGVVVDRLRGIRHDQVEVEFDDVAEAVTQRTCAERI